MRSKLKIMLVTLTLLNLTNQSNAQLLNMVDVVPPTQCGNWCWARATTNVIHYYGEATPTIDAILEYERYLNYFGSSCTTCVDLPTSSCCQTVYYPEITNILKHWGIRASQVNGIPSTADLSAEFSANKPIIIQLTDHVIVGHGIKGDSVQIIDQMLGNVFRKINNIYTNRSWESTFFMSYPPNCSNYAHIHTNGSVVKRTFNYRDWITVSGNFSSTTDMKLYTDGYVDFLPDFKLNENSNLEVYTGNSNCP